jgi:soluble lytic murein transglycosylase-like protein
MKKFFIFFIAIFSAALLAAATGPAFAEPERYDFPKFKPKTESVPLKFHSGLSRAPADVSVKPAANPRGTPAKPKPAREPGLREKNEAKRRCIAALLRQYNKKLSEKEAYDYAVLIIQTSDKFKQNPFVIAAMIVNESSARHDAVSRGGDYGLMQVRWRVHRKTIRKKYPHIAEAKDILNPRNNLTVGVEIFSNYRARVDNDLRQALLTYSAGNSRLADKIFAVLSKLEKSYTERLQKT